MNKDKEAASTAASPAPKRPWIAPTVLELPRLTELTLQSMIPGRGFIGDGGSTVF